MTPDLEAQLETALATLPRVQLASIRPTPLEPLAKLSALLGGPDIYIKRDDLTGLAFGGNKTRMLELSLADAIEKGAEVIVCGSAVQSNYCRQMAAACARLDLELHLILRPVRPIDHKEVQGNHLLMRLFGANVEILPDAERHIQGERIRQRVEKLRTAGRKVYRPREEDTIDLDALAYAESALEIVQQARLLDIEPKFLYCAALDTTQAGVALGLTFLESGIHTCGFSPFENQTDRFEDMARIANQGAGRIGLGITMGADDFDNDDSFVGERYGVPTPECIEAIRTTARTEGLLLDPVYTGKAMAALFSHVREGKLTKADSPIVFLHTGGYSALFGYAKDVLK